MVMIAGVAVAVRVIMTVAVVVEMAGFRVQAAPQLTLGFLKEFDHAFSGGFVKRDAQRL